MTHKSHLPSLGVSWLDVGCYGARYCTQQIELKSTYPITGSLRQRQELHTIQTPEHKCLRVAMGINAL